MVVKLIYVTDEEFDILSKNLKMGGPDCNSLGLENKIIFMRDKFEEKEMPTLTRAEAIEKFQRASYFNNSEKIIDFYVKAGMLEVKEEEEKPIFEIKGEIVHIKIWPNGEVSGIKGIVINRIPELIAKLKQNNS